MIDKTYQCLFCLVLLFGLPQKQAVAQEIIPVRLRWLTTEGPANAVRCLPGGREVAVGGVTQGSNDILQIWDIERRRVVYGSKVGDVEIQAISIDAKGATLAAIGLPSRAFLWDLTNRKRLKDPVVDKADFVRVVCLQTTGEHLAVLSANQGLRIWNVAEGTWTDFRAAPPPKIFSVHYAEKLWVGTVAGEVWEYHEDRWQRLLAAPTPPSTVLSLQRVDHEQLFVLTEDGVIRWLSEGQVAGRVLLEDRLGKPVAMAVHPSGKRLVTVTNRGQLRFWNVLTDSAEPVGKAECFDEVPTDPGDSVADLSVDQTSGLIAVAISSGGVRLFRSDWWRGGPCGIRQPIVGLAVASSWACFLV